MCHDNMIIFGGCSKQEQDTNQSDMYQFNTITKKWEEIIEGSGKIEGRREHGAVVFGEMMAIHAGKGSSSTLFSDVHLFDLGQYITFCIKSFLILFFLFSKGSRKWQEVEEQGMNPPTARYGHTILVADNALWIFGGLGLESPHDDEEKNLNDLHAFALGE